MRILLVTDWLRRRGGVEAYFGTLRKGLREAGHDVRLLTSTAGDAASGSADYRAYGTDAPLAQAILQIANPAAVVRTREALAAFRPDIAFVGMVEQHLSPAIFPALRGVPTILSVADYKPVCPIHSKLLPNGSLCTVEAGPICWRGGCVSLAHWLRDRPRYALYRSGIANVDRVLACSRWLQRALAADDIAAEVLPLSAAAPPPGFLREPAPAPLFVYVGRLSVEKGVAILLRAFARVSGRLPAARLRIVGDGAERPTLERLAADLGLREAVGFAGWQQPDAVERELRPAWAMVAPSLWAEPLGLVAIEAIVRGVPVVATATGGFAETVEPGATGLLVPNGDVESLADCLGRIASCEEFPSHVLRADVVRDTAERHSVERHVARVEQICREVAPVR